MRGLWLLAGVMAGVLVGHLECCPSEPDLEQEGYTERWFEGTIGERRVRMYVAHDDKSAAGVFYYLREFQPFILGGTLRDGRIELREKYGEEDLEPPPARLDGRMTPGGLTGMWIPGSPDSQQEVRLTRIDEPSCDVKGPMRVFNDPRWPIVFSYPESWHVKATGETISFSCPNPALMAYDGMGLDLALHAGPPAGEEYRRSGSQWKYLKDPDCDTKDAEACPVAKVAKRDGITVLGPNDFSLRMYCLGEGYFGLGGGLVGQFIGNGWWIELRATGPEIFLLEHVVATARRR